MPECSIKLNKSPQRILVVPLRFIGDTIVTVPLIRNLRQAFHQAHIGVLATQATAPLLERCPYVNAVFIEPKGPLPTLGLLKQGAYDAVFLLRKSVTFAALCKWAGIPLVVGYDKQRFFKPFHYKRWGWFLDAIARYPSLKTDIHQARHHLSLLNAVGLTPHDDDLELWTHDDDAAVITQLMLQHGIDAAEKLAVIHAVSASHGKTVAIEKYGLAVQHLAQAGYQIIATGMAADRPLYETLAQQTEVPIHNWAGLTSLPQTVALYQRIQLILTVDSSPLHMAAAVGVPIIIGVFGPTNQQQWGVLNPQLDFRPVFKDLPCRPCYAKVCSHNNCRETLTAEDILSALC